MKKSETSHRAPSAEEIAEYAYNIYEREGRPAGRDLDHWFAAEAQLASECAKTARASRSDRRAAPALGSKLNLPPATTPPVTNRNTRASILLPAPRAS
jgi:hypothetical protein